MTSNDINFIPAIKFIEEKFNMLTNEKEKKVKDKKERMNNFKKKLMGKAEEIVAKIEDIIIDETEDIVAKVEDFVDKVEDAILDVTPIIVENIIEPMIKAEVQILLAPVLLVAPVLAHILLLAEDEAERKLNTQLHELINRSRKKQFRK